MKAIHLLLLVLFPALASAQVARFRVTETAGLRRFNYPVRATIRADSTALALQENGKPVPAQFTAIGGGRVEIDFNVAHGPWESREYRVERGEGPAPPSAISVTEGAGVFSVRTGMQYDVRQDLDGLLAEVKNNRTSWLRPGSAGLSLDGAKLVAAKAEIVKRGPLVAAFRFEAGGNIVQLDFPRSKSWVEVRWTAPRAGAMSAGVNLNIEGAPTLIDFGANSTVYATLRAGQRIAFGAQPGSWFVNLGDEPYASSKSTTAEGWAHVMDLQRATAIAVDGFGRRSADRIEAAADGATAITRRAARELHFWLHFVPMPVQVGAATSPQSMMAPLRVNFMNP